MSIFLTAIVFIIVFSIVVLVHELGHYFLAKRYGITVEEFGIGLPPRLFSWRSSKNKDMVWSINWIPFGGFVKLRGEDALDQKALKDPKSFAGKTLSQRFKVVIAGVLMNFLLAFLLLTIGFSVGIEPLMVNGEDFLKNLDAGNIFVQEGATIKEVKEGSFAYQNVIRGGDMLLAVNGKKIADPEIWYSLVNTPLKEEILLSVWRRGKEKEIKLMPDAKEKGKWGVEFYGLIVLPRLAIFDVKALSSSYYEGLQAGDVILQMNGKNVYSISDYDRILTDTKEKMDYLILRDHKELHYTVPLRQESRTMITEVLPGSVAEKAGIMEGDILLEINGKNVLVPTDTRELLNAVTANEITLKVQRGLDIQSLKLNLPKSGYMGVALSMVDNYRNEHLSVYNVGILSAVLDVNEVSYPIYEAPFKVWGEMKRLSSITAKMFGTVIAKIVGEGRVPEGVAGPVGIAQMTYIFMQKGFAALIRFMALLSLSLAVINILPLPALDGGRLFFILLEALWGSSLNPKWESRIHGFGFVFLILLILFVTYNDIIRAIGW